MTRLLTLMLLVVGLPASALSAQQPLAPIRSSTGGLLLGLGLNGSSVRFSEAGVRERGRDSGTGVKATLGYNATPRLGVLLTATGATFSADGDPYGLGHVDLGIRYTFAGPSRTLIPYLEGARSGLVFRDEYEGPDVDVSGSGWTGAAGLHYFFSRRAALDASLRYSAGELSGSTNGGTDAMTEPVPVTTIRLDLGVTVFPFAR